MKKYGFCMFSAAALALAVFLYACEAPYGIKMNVTPSLNNVPIKIDLVGVTDYLKAEKIESMMPKDAQGKPLFTVKDVNAKVYNGAAVGDPDIDGTIVQTFALHYTHVYGIDLTEAATGVDLDSVFKKQEFQWSGVTITQPPYLSSDPSYLPNNGIEISIPALSDPNEAVIDIAGMEYILKIEFEKNADLRVQKPNSENEVKLYYGAAGFDDAKAAYSINADGNIVTYKFKITDDDYTSEYSSGFSNTNSTKIFLRFPALIKYNPPTLDFNWKKAKVNPSELDLDTGGVQDLEIDLPDLRDLKTSLKEYGMELVDGGAYAYLYVQMADGLFSDTSKKLELYIDEPTSGAEDINIVGSENLPANIWPARYIASPFTGAALSEAATTGFIKNAPYTSSYDRAGETANGKAIPGIMKLFTEQIDDGKKITCKFHYGLPDTEREVVNPDEDTGVAAKGSSVGATIDLVILLPLKVKLDETTHEENTDEENTGLEKNTDLKIGDEDDPDNTALYTKLTLKELDGQFDKINMDEQIQSLLNGLGLEKEKTQVNATSFTISEVDNSLFRVAHSDPNVDAAMYVVARDRDAAGEKDTTQPWKKITRVSSSGTNKEPFKLQGDVKYLPEIAIFVDKGSNMQIGRNGVFTLRASIGMDVNMEL
jgi:hypothetical protein